jgi:2-hydroxychromene-2-carboxylate isomerase
MCPNADLASGIVIAADAQGLPVLELYKAILRAQWCEERDISSEATLREILAAHGFDGDAMLARARSAETQEIYRRNTDEAVAAGVFGSPSYVFDGELFWGQDRLHMLEVAVAVRLTV